MNTLDIKIELSRAVIQRALKEYPLEKWAVGCSFGKDSMAVLHLVREVHPDVHVVYENTGVEYPQTLEFRKRMVKEWNLNLYEVKPVDWNFWKCAKQYGFPKEVRGKGKGAHNPQCCVKLKEEPAKRAYQQLGIKLAFTGLTAAESRNRMLFFKRCGEYYFRKEDGIQQCHPIASWTVAEVFAYHKLNNIPLNPLYLQYSKLKLRVGCRTCTGFRGWRKKMAIVDPKLYRMISEMLGQKLIDPTGAQCPTEGE